MQYWQRHTWGLRIWRQRAAALQLAQLESVYMPLFWPNEPKCCLTACFLKKKHKSLTVGSKNTKIYRDSNREPHYGSASSTCAFPWRVTMHHCWYRLASARVAEIHANSFIRTPYADVYSRQILASMVEEAWSGSIAKVDGSFQVISPSLCLGTCFSTGKCCFVHWKTATFFFSSGDWLPWDKLNQTVFVGKLLSLGDRYNSSGTFCTSLPLLASERLRSGDACYEVNMEALATLLLVLARWGLSARLVRETQAFSLPEFHKHDKKQTLLNFCKPHSLCIWSRGKKLEYWFASQWF